MNISKQGKVVTKRLLENQIIEPDGSKWLHIFHHSNPANYKFNSSDSFTTEVFIDENRWFNVSTCNKVTKWELMVKQRPLIGSPEQKYRWVQTANPMACPYSSVTADKVVYNTTEGYNTTGYGGLFKKVSNTYLAADNGTSGNNWWGAIGSWGAHRGGIPGWNSDVIKTGNIDLYLRIDGTELDSDFEKVKFYNSKIVAYDFIEM